MLKVIYYNAFVTCNTSVPKFHTHRIVTVNKYRNILYYITYFDVVF